MIYGYMIENKDLIYKKEKVIIVIYTQAKLKSPIHFLDEGKKDPTDRFKDYDSARATLYLITENNVECSIYIRNVLGGGRNGLPSKHGCSIKIVSPTINGESNIPIIVPQKQGEKAIIDTQNSKTKKK